MPRSQVELVSLAQFPGLAEPEETGATFAENARLKALYYAEATGLPSVADDSGLEIDALDNAPGVHSARWHGTDYAVKFRKIYELLRERGANGSAGPVRLPRRARRPRRILFETAGIVEGEIAPEPRGTNGFGYDPIFFYPPSAAPWPNSTSSERPRVSHRGQAFYGAKQVPWNAEP